MEKKTKIIIAVVIVLVIAVVIYFYMKNKKAKAKADAICNKSLGVGCVLLPKPQTTVTSPLTSSTTISE